MDNLFRHRKRAVNSCIDFRHSKWYHYRIFHNLIHRCSFFFFVTKKFGLKFWAEQIQQVESNLRLI